MAMPEAMLLMTFGNQVGATQTNLDLKSFVMSSFFKKKVLGENKILSGKNVWFIDYCTFKCIVLCSTRQSSYYPNEDFETTI